jgi:hypothetical protein
MHESIEKLLWIQASSPTHSLSKAYQKSRAAEPQLERFQASHFPHPSRARLPNQQCVSVLEDNGWGGLNLLPLLHALSFSRACQLIAMTV